MKVGIAGFGFVGQAVRSCMIDAPHAIYDPGYFDLHNIDKLRECDIIFCCIGTPQNTDGSQDFFNYEAFFRALEDYEGILVIKSTVLFTNIEPHLAKYNVVMNPEFLNQNTASEDFGNQHTIILGGRMDHCLIVQDCYELMFYSEQESVHYKFCSHKEAIEIKYFHNIYNAYKALFWNYVLETCGNHRKMASLYQKIVGSGNEMSQVAADGKLGYGGACFMKDVAAFHNEREHELTDFMEEFNARLRKLD